MRQHLCRHVELEQLDASLCTDAVGQGAEGREPIVAGAVPVTARREVEGRVEVGLALAVVSDRWNQAQKIEDRLVPGDIESVSLDAPVVDVVAVVGVQCPVERLEVASKAREQGELVAGVRTVIRQGDSRYDGLLVGIGEIAACVLV